MSLYALKGKLHACMNDKQPKNYFSMNTALLHKFVIWFRHELNSSMSYSERTQHTTYKVLDYYLIDIKI